MRIIDKTPFQNEQGQIEFMSRLQGTLKFGPNWYAEVQAQKTVISQLDHILEKGFVLIRNFNLPGSEVIVPLILVGPNGITIIYVTNIKGFYEAKGDQWNRLDNGRPVAASVDLLNRVVRLARATTVYLQRQKITIPGVIEPVLIAADPGLHVETLRPIARVVMSDAIKQYASSLLTARPVLRNEQAYELAERIVTPREVEPGPEPLPAAAPVVPASERQAPVYEPPSYVTPAYEGEVPASAPDRARAIFDAAETAKPFDPNDLSFAFEDEPEAADLSSGPAAPASAPAPSRPPAGGLLPAGWNKKRYLGMQPAQLAFLGVLVLIEFCILAAAVYYIR